MKYVHSENFFCLGSKITVDIYCSHEIKRCLLLGRKAVTNLDSILKSKCLCQLCWQSSGPSSSHVQMWELDHKEGWVPKNWCFRTVMLEKTLESPLDCKDIKPVNHKEKQPWNIHCKDWCWSWSSNTLATWCEVLTHWKRPWCWEKLKAKGEGGSSGWDG